MTRWLDREALAAHISVRVDELPRLQRQGKLPTPSLHLGPKTPRWDQDAVDAMFSPGVASPCTLDMERKIVEAYRAKAAPPRFGRTIRGR